MSEITTNGWNEYKQRIFYQLEELTKRVERIDTKMDKLSEDIIILKTKAWLFGVLGGVVVTAVFQFLIAFLSK